MRDVVLVTQFYVQFFATLWTIAHQAPLSRDTINQIELTGIYRRLYLIRIDCILFQPHIVETRIGYVPDHKIILDKYESF